MLAEENKVEMLDAIDLALLPPPPADDVVEDDNVEDADEELGLYFRRLKNALAAPPPPPLLLLPPFAISFRWNSSGLVVFKNSTSACVLLMSLRSEPKEIELPPPSKLLLPSKRW